jgi:hypothetical protein
VIERALAEVATRHRVNRDLRVREYVCDAADRGESRAAVQGARGPGAEERVSSYVIALYVFLFVVAEALFFAWVAGGPMGGSS